MLGARPTMHSRSTSTVIAFLAFVLVGTYSTRSDAMTSTWTGNGTNDNWSNAANWNTPTAPGAGDTAVFNANGTGDVVVDVPVGIQSLQVAGNYVGTLTLNEDLTLTGDMTLNSALFGGGSQFTIESPSNKELAIGGNLAAGFLQPFLIVNSGTVTVDGNFSLSSRARYIQNGGSMTVKGTVDLNTSFYLLGGFVTEFDMNGGTFTAEQDITVSGFTAMDIDNATVRTDQDFTVGNNASVDLNDGGFLSIGGTLDDPGGNLNQNGGVLPVTLDRFEARSEGAGVLLTWHVSSEYRNAGFNLWRRLIGKSGGEWERVNEALVPGRITNATPKTYRWFDWAEPGEYAYRIEDVDVLGNRVLHALLTSRVTVDVQGDLAAAEEHVWRAVLAGIEREARAVRRARLERLVDRIRPASGRSGGWVARVERVTDVASARTNQDNRPNPADVTTAPKENGALIGPVAVAKRRAATGTASPYSAAKVVHSGSGVLMVPQAMLPDGYDCGQVRVFRGGKEVTALAQSAEGLVLHAPGYRDEYTDRDVFFLRAREGSTSAGHVTRVSGLFAPGVVALGKETARETVRFEDVYMAWPLRPLQYPPWFSEKILTENSLHEFTLNLPHLLPGAGRIEIQVYSLSDQPGVSPDHALQLFVNGVPSGEAHWDGAGEMMRLSFDVPDGTLKSGENLIELATPSIPGVESQIAFVYAISAEYEKAFCGPGEVRISGAVDGPANRVYEVKGLTTDGLWVVDARTEDAATLVGYETRVEGDGSVTARFRVDGGMWGGTGGLLVVPMGRELAPESVTSRTIRGAPEVEYLAVGPAQFADAIEPLLDARARQGLSTAFVDQEALFDAYGHGRYGPQSIRAAVREIRPRFLLLLGRSTSDYLNREGKGVDPLCPTFLAATSTFSHAPCDALFGDLGNGFAEVAVGRFPVLDAAELEVAVARTLSYRVKGKTVRRGLLVADGLAPGDPDFHAAMDGLARRTRGVQWRKAYLGSASFPDGASITDAMKDAADGNADLILFAGHGSSTRLSKSQVLDTSKAADWTGNVVLLQATCTANYFVHNQTDFHSIAEALLTQPQGGISASVATTTWAPGAALNTFMSDLLNASRKPGMTWGEALMEAQRKSHDRTMGAWDSLVPAYRDLARSECLLGDPALQANGVLPDFTKPPQRAENESPVAVALGSPARGPAPLTVSFDGGDSQDTDGVLVSHAWDFGDGTRGVGATVNHTYTVAGTYLARLTVTDDDGATDTATVRVVVAVAGQAGPPSEEDPAFESLLVRRMLIRLRFDVSGRDLIRMTGLVPVPAGHALRGEQLVLNVGGVEQVFTLDARGRGRAAKGRCRVRVGKTGDMARVELVLLRGDFAPALADEGLVDNDVRRRSVSVPVTVALAGKRYQWGLDATERLSYTARSGRWGMAKAASRKRLR